MEIKHISNYLGRVEDEERYQKNRMEEEGNKGDVHTFYWWFEYDYCDKSCLFTGRYHSKDFSFWSSEIKDLRDIDKRLSISEN